MTWQSIDGLNHIEATHKVCNYLRTIHKFNLIGDVNTIIMAPFLISAFIDKDIDMGVLVKLLRRAQQCELSN